MSLRDKICSMSDDINDFNINRAVDLCNKTIDITHEGLQGIFTNLYNASVHHYTNVLDEYQNKIAKCNDTLSSHKDVLKEYEESLDAENDILLKKEQNERDIRLNISNLEEDLKSIPQKKTELFSNCNTDIQNTLDTVLCPTKILRDTLVEKCDDFKDKEIIDCQMSGYTHNETISSSCDCFNNEYPLSRRIKQNNNTLGFKCTFEYRNVKCIDDLDMCDLPDHWGITWGTKTELPGPKEVVNYYKEGSLVLDTRGAFKNSGIFSQRSSEGVDLVNNMIEEFMYVLNIRRQISTNFFSSCADIDGDICVLVVDRAIDTDILNSPTITQELAIFKLKKPSVFLINMADSMDTMNDNEKKFISAMTSIGDLTDDLIDTSFKEVFNSKQGETSTERQILTNMAVCYRLMEFMFIIMEKRNIKEPPLNEDSLTDYHLVYLQSLPFIPMLPNVDYSTSMPSKMCTEWTIHPNIKSDGKFEFPILILYMDLEVTEKTLPKIVEDCVELYRDAGVALGAINAVPGSTVNEKYGKAFVSRPSLYIETIDSEDGIRHITDQTRILYR